MNKNTIKLIKSLALKKNRIKENLFVAEGDKIVSEVLTSDIKIEKLFATNSFLASRKPDLRNTCEVIEVTQNDIDRASLLKNPQNCLALCRPPTDSGLPGELDNLSVYLDGIQDPGNLGTILRICDWFGLFQLFCSTDTVDVFNPKVIQASMGSFSRVKVWKSSFTEIAEIADKSNTRILGAYLDGENIYTEKLPRKALIVMGNEGNGIRPELENKIEERIKIPSLSKNSNRAESLNVSVATAIICSEFMRQHQFPDYSK